MPSGYKVGVSEWMQGDGYVHTGRCIYEVVATLWIQSNSKSVDSADEE